MKRKVFSHHLQQTSLRLGQLLAAHGVSEYTIMIVLAVILGTVAGLTAVGFHETIQLVTKLTHMLARQSSHSQWLIILIPALGMAIQRLMIRCAPDQAGKRGVLQIIKSVHIDNGEIPFRTTLFHFFAPAICIGTGGTVGPEAPAAQSGAGAVSQVGQWLGLSDHRLQMFTAAGAGAAIAGVFNTPLAGIFFAIEVILLNEFNASALSIFLLSSVSASVVSRVFLGNAPKFHFGTMEVGSYSSIAFYLLLGLLAGLLSVSFLSFNQVIKKFFQRLYTRIPQFVGMVAIGLIMGVAGWKVPQILGIGYDSINAILEGEFSPFLILFLMIAKLVLVVLILRSGGFGGMFAPSLFIGACFGNLFAFTANHLFPVHLDPTAYTLVGMGAVLAGVNSIPLTAIMILFEMTNNYFFILPLMLGVVGSTMITQLFMHGSIYKTELGEAGYRFSLGYETNILHSISVEEVVQPDIKTVTENAPIADIVKEFLHEHTSTLYVINDSGQMIGRITSSSMRLLITDFDALENVLVAKDILDPEIVYIDAQESLEDAIHMFSRYNLEEIPVIVRGRQDQPLGVLHYQDVLKTYNEKIAKMRLVDGIARDFRTLESHEIRDIIPGFALSDLNLPNEFVGKTLGDLKLRNRFRIDVLVVERQTDVLSEGEAEPKRLMPDKDFMLLRGDRLIVYGQTADIAELKKNWG